MMPSDKIRIVIVDDVAETRENIKKVFDLDTDIELVGEASTGNEGVAITKELKPDVVIMDISMPGMDGIAATEAIKNIVPYAQIIILSVQGDPDYMRRAMLVGARDFITKPPQINELISAIKRAAKVAQTEKQKLAAQSQYATKGIGLSSPGGFLGKIILFYSPKGGTGCTTVATNIGVTLHNIETPVVLVDANFQFGDVAVFLNEHSKNSIADLTPRVNELDNEILEEVLLNHKQSGVKILASPSRPEYADDITGEQFLHIVQQLKNLFYYVIIDCNSWINDSILAVLEESDLIVLITTQEIPSIKNARLFIDITKMLSLDQKKILFVMNRYDKRIGITPEKIGESFKQEIVATLPFDDKLVIPSINRGIPFMLGDKSRPIAKAYLSLAETIRKKLNELSDQTV